MRVGSGTPAVSKLEIFVTFVKESVKEFKEFVKESVKKFVKEF